MSEATRPQEEREKKKKKSTQANPKLKPLPNGISIIEKCAYYAPVDHPPKRDESAPFLPTMATPEKRKVLHSLQTELLLRTLCLFDKRESNRVLGTSHDASK